MDLDESLSILHPLVFKHTSSDYRLSNEKFIWKEVRYMNDKELNNIIKFNGVDFILFFKPHFPINI